MKADRVIFTIFVFLAVTGLGEGVIITLLPAFVKESLQGGAPELGWLMSAQAVGGLIGGLVVGHATKALTPACLLGLSAVGFGLIDLVIFNYPAFFSGIALGLILFVVVGGILGDIIGVVVMLNVQGGAYVLAGILVLMLLAGVTTVKAHPTEVSPR